MVYKAFKSEIFSLTIDNYSEQSKKPEQSEHSEWSESPRDYHQYISVHLRKVSQDSIVSLHLCGGHHVTAAMFWV